MAATRASIDSAEGAALDDASPAELVRDLFLLLTRVIDGTDNGHGAGHGRRVGWMAWQIAERAGLPDAADLYYAGLLHDVGAVGLPQHPLDLAHHEFPTPAARRHGPRGAALLRAVPLLRPLAPLLAAHHERSDGGGFPAGLRGSDIPEGASALLLADTLDVALAGAQASEHTSLASRVVEQLSHGGVPGPLAAAADDLLRSGAKALAPWRSNSRISAIDAPAGRPSWLPMAATSRGVLVELLWLLGRILDLGSGRSGHAARVALLAHRLACVASTEPNVARDAALVALCCDVGAAVRYGAAAAGDDAIPARTYSWLRELPTLARLAPAAASVHERFDGSGGPHGIAGDRIPLVARIVAIARAFDLRAASQEAQERMLPTEAIVALRPLWGTALDQNLAELALSVFEREAMPAGLVPDVERLLIAAGVVSERDPDERQGPASLVPARGALMVTLEPWVRVGLGDDLRMHGDAEKLARIVGLPAESSLAELLEPESAAEVTAELRRLDEGALHTQYVFSRTGRPLEVILQRCDGVTNLLCRSANNRLQTMEKLALFYQGFLSTTEAVVFTDPDGTILDVNRAFLNLYGYPLREVVGQHTRLLKSGRHPPAFYERMWGAISDPAIGHWSGEVTDRARDGRELEVQLTISAVRSASGTLLGFVGRALDVSTRREAERELAVKNGELERMVRLMRDLVAITSHDLKGPLASILSVARLARDNHSRLGPERTARYLEHVAESASHLLALVTDILDLEKLESGSLELRMRRCRLPALLQYCTQQVQQHSSKNIEVHLSVLEGPATVLLDPVRVEQALTNLLSNAVKFSAAGGRVSLTCTGTDTDRLLLTVDDEGPGLPDEALQTVFDRFYQVKAGANVPRRAYGTGLGLHIVRSLVALHGGRVWAENRPSGGCRFAVEIPARTRAPAMRQTCALLYAPTSTHALALARDLEALGVAVELVDGIEELRRWLRVLDVDLVFAHEDLLDDQVLEQMRALSIQSPRPVLARITPHSSQGELSPFDLSMPLPASADDRARALDEMRRQRESMGRQG